VAATLLCAAAGRGGRRAVGARDLRLEQCLSRSSLQGMERQGRVQVVEVGRGSHRGGELRQAHRSRQDPANTLQIGGLPQLTEATEHLTGRSSLPRGDQLIQQPGHLVQCDDDVLVLLVEGRIEQAAQALPGIGGRAGVYLHPHPGYGHAPLGGAALGHDGAQSHAAESRCDLVDSLLDAGASFDIDTQRDPTAFHELAQDVGYPGDLSPETVSTVSMLLPADTSPEVRAMVEVMCAAASGFFDDQAVTRAAEGAQGRTALYGFWRAEQAFASAVSAARPR
jgi:hypothetical protein